MLLRNIIACEWSMRGVWCRKFHMKNQYHDDNTYPNVVIYDSLACKFLVKSEKFPIEILMKGNKIVWMCDDVKKDSRVLN